MEQFAPDKIPYLLLQLIRLTEVDWCHWWSVHQQHWIDLLMAWITAVEVMLFNNTMISQSGDHHYFSQAVLLDIRNSGRVIMDSYEKAEFLWKRIKPFIPQTLFGRRVMGLNERYVLTLASNENERLWIKVVSICLHKGQNYLHDPRIFYPSGHWPETVTNAHVSAHFR